MRHVIRTYTFWEFIYRIWDRQTLLIKTKKKRKKTGAFEWCILLSLSVKRPFPVSILHKSTAGRYRPVRVADGPITARCRFMKKASWVDLLDMPTAPGCFAVSVYSHVSHKRINYQTSVTDDSC